MGFENSNRTLSVFISYASQDNDYLKNLEAHLSELQRSKIIEYWHNGKLLPGESATISKTRLEQSDLIIILLSADYLASEELHKELERAVNCKKNKKTRLLPIMVRHVDLYNTVISSIQVLPRDDTGVRPVSAWAHRDEAWVRTYRELRQILELPPEPVTHLRLDVEARPSTRVLSLLDELNELRSQLASSSSDAPQRDSMLLRAREIRHQLQNQGPRLEAGYTLDKGRYHLLGILGKGGFGTVWRAHDAERQHDVAIKVLHQHFETYTGRQELGASIDRFYRGGRRMADLSHPHIVRILEKPRKENHFHYFIMEYIEGGDLEHATKSGWLPPEQIVRAILQVGEALQVAHDKGLIHCDLRPANILLDSARNARLTDFDLVWVNDGSIATMTPGPKGTLLYSAPEMLGSDGNPKPTVDVYSLGATLLAALYRQSWSRPLPLERKILNQLNCSDAMKSVLRTALHEEADQRYQSVSAFCAALQAVADLPTLESLPKRFFIEQTQLMMEEQRTQTLHRYARVVQESHKPDEMLTSLEAEARKNENWHDLTKLYRVLSERCSYDLEWRKKLWPRLAELYSEHPEDMESFCVMVLEHEPENQYAIDGLAQLYSKQGDWGKYVSLLEWNLEYIREPSQKLDILWKIATISHGKMHENEQAIKACIAILAINQNKSEVYQLLEEIYLKMSRWEDLALLYVTQSLIDKNPVHHGKMLRAAANIYFYKLENDTEALRLHCQALELAYSKESIDAAKALALNTGMWHGLLRAYEACCKLSIELSQRIEILKEMAIIHKMERCDITQAIGALRTALQMQPRNNEIENLLLEYYRIGQRWSEIEQYHIERKNWQKLICAYNIQIDSLRNQKFHALIYCKIGNIYEKGLMNNKLAIENYQRALMIDSGLKDALDSLSRLEGNRI